MHHRRRACAQSHLQPAQIRMKPAFCSRHEENLMIACGRKHFALAKDMVFRDLVALEGLVV